MIDFMKLLSVFIVILFLLGFSCDEPTVKNGGCPECEVVVYFDRSDCPTAIQKVYAITVDDGITTQSWMDTYSNYPGGAKSFEIECNKKVYITFTRECEYENGEIYQSSDVRTIYPQGCIASKEMIPERNY